MRWGLLVIKLPEKYAAARHAIAAASRIDEAKSIRDKALAMEVYAFQAKDNELVAHSIEMRKRATRRIGELMAEQRAAGKLAKGGGDQKSKNHRVAKKPSDKQSLAAQGVDKNLADQARKLAAQPKETFERSVARDVAIGIAAVQDSNAVVKAARKESVQAKLANRKTRHEAIKTAAVGGLLTGQFPLLYADPPWHFQTYTPSGGMRSPDEHYPTLDDDGIVNFQINGRPIREIAHDDAALFLWCTSSNIPLALKVMEGWGFSFRTSAVWVKDKQGMGLIFRNWHEVLLYGSRGNMPGPLYIPPSVFSFPRGEHSVKPLEIRQEIERMFPAFKQTQRLELFARGAIPGWTTYGYETVSQAAE